MRNPALKEPVRHRTSRMRHVAVWLAATMIVVASGVPSAAAESTSSAVAADAAWIAQQLAATAPSDPVGSCGTDAGFSSVAQPFAMFAGGGGLAAMPADPSALQVVCALPYTNGRPGSDCNGRHFVQYNLGNYFDPDPLSEPIITAELMGLDVNGNLIGALLVQDGDRAHLASRLDPDDWKIQRSGNSWDVFAPVPLLKVTVQDEGETAVAYCSNIPWVDVVQPSGGVVTESAGNAPVDVLAAVPRTHIADLQLLVDGVDLLPQVVPNYEFCTPDSPCSGIADINGVPVEYTDLAIGIAPVISAFASNTVSVTLNGLLCGGHFIRVTTEQVSGALRNPTSSSCNIDDLTDQGGFSIFGITITDPVPGQVTTTIPTPVAGEVCAGTEIVDVNINGMTLPLGGQMFAPGNGEDMGDLYTVKINTSLLQSDLVADVLVSQDEPLGTFDAGSNRLAASAREIGGVRAYEQVIFATGAVAPIGIATEAAFLDVNGGVFTRAALEAEVDRQFRSALEANLLDAVSATETEIDNAFIVGISADGAQNLFNKLCSEPGPSGQTPGEIFSDTVTAALLAFNQDNPLVNDAVWEAPCSCNPKFDIFISDVSVGTDVTCPITFETDGDLGPGIGQINVRLELPDVSVTARALGSCETEELGICIARTEVDVTATASVEDIFFDYRITEPDLLATATSNPVFSTGAVAEGTAVGGVDVDCLGEVCNILLENFVFFLTFGQVDIGPLLEPEIDITGMVDFSAEITPARPDAIPLQEIKVDEQVVMEFDQQLSGIVSAVNITDDGISAGLRGSFATTLVDMSVPSTPGITLTPAGVPDMGAMQAQGAQDALIGLSDDTINMLFASLTAAGNLSFGDAQGCFDTGATVGSLLPADCDTLLLDGGLAEAGARGYCHAIQGNDCDSLVFGADVNLTSTEQGVCHGASGSVCTEIFGGDLVKWGACAITPNFNLQATQPLLVCAKGDVPPRMLFPDAGAPGGTVASALRVNDISIGLVIDRTENNMVDGPLNDAPNCFDGTSTASDCNVFAACLDLNWDFFMQNITCDDNSPGFRGLFNTPQFLFREVGVVCSGATSPTSDEEILSAASDDFIEQNIGDNAAGLWPEICGLGLDLGFLTCANPEILTLEADLDPELRDYIALTCSLQ